MSESCPHATGGWSWARPDGIAIQTKINMKIVQRKIRVDFATFFFFYTATFSLHKHTHTRFLFFCNPDCDGIRRKRGAGRICYSSQVQRQPISMCVGLSLFFISIFILFFLRLLLLLSFLFWYQKKSKENKLEMNFKSSGLKKKTILVWYCKHDLSWASLHPSWPAPLTSISLAARTATWDDRRAIERPKWPRVSLSLLASIRVTTDDSLHFTLSWIANQVMINTERYHWFPWLDVWRP